MRLLISWSGVTEVRSALKSYVAPQIPLNNKLIFRSVNLESKSCWRSRFPLPNASCCDKFFSEASQVPSIVTSEFYFYGIRSTETMNPPWMRIPDLGSNCGMSSGHIPIVNSWWFIVTCSNGRLTVDFFVHCHLLPRQFYFIERMTTLQLLDTVHVRRHCPTTLNVKYWIQEKLCKTSISRNVWHVHNAWILRKNWIPTA